MVNAAGLLALCNTTVNPVPFSPGFDIASVVPYVQTLPVYSWSLASASEALLEYYNPHLSVFGPSPFPVQTVAEDSVIALQYAASKIVFGTGADTLAPGLGSTADAAGLGVSAVLLGKTNATYAKAVTQQLDYITQSAPRYSNGAISHRTDVPELWSDFIYMGPPFMAYVAADQKNLALLQTAYVQCGLYRQILKSPSGAWEHIVGPEAPDLGLYSTGNGFAAGGMVRVLATVMKAPVAIAAKWRPQAISDLTHWIQEIIDGAMSFSTDNGLLRNYLSATTSDGGFGEITGTSMLVAPHTFGKKYIQWADKMRGTLAKHISSNGIAAPTVNPLNWTDPTPYTTGSPEGQNFVVLMYAGWRDCVLADICSK
ncbi:hypothetical protein B0H17DRAFT_1141052 [Mycena rosella]|uniref:Six-hairpin glycosidase n=1 Tax=Mycena rosella TaxID=1033263 RepID=A0AAD7D0F5_MYCRO|nr:hypothetical protein B0H17DRAFT_1141052 [Mycena rosella]